MMLVLIVLVATLAISFPSLSRIYGHHQLRQGAELAQVRLTSARVHALESGIIYQFRYEPGGRRFVVLPYEMDAVTARTGEASSGGGLYKQADELSANARFASGGGTQNLSDSLLSGMPNAGTLIGVAWSAPILFFPDGTSTSAIIDVADPKGDTVRLSVRSLTGGVTLGTVEGH